MIAFVLKQADDKLLATLLFQKCKDFKVYLPAEDHLTADYEGKISLVNGRLQDVAEPLVCLLEPGAVPDRDFVRRVLRSTRRHPDFNVYHVNQPLAEPWPRKLKGDKLFKRHIQEGLKAPLSSFVFRTPVLMERAVFRADSSLDVLATVLACSKDKPIRNVWHQKLQWLAPQVEQTPELQEKRVRNTLEFFRWTEQFYQDDTTYPFSVAERMEMIAKEVVKLYPAHTPEQLREEMLSFKVSQGPIRKVRASTALKNALKERQQSLM